MLKYSVESAGNVIAKFGKRSAAVSYALDSGLKTVVVRRKTNLTNRLVFSSSTTSNGGFTTVTSSETFRSK